MNKSFNQQSKQAFYYHKQDASVSSQPPNHVLSNQINNETNNHNNIINLVYGKTDKVNQTGGGFYYDWNKYNYIINPKTDRKVSIHSKLGKTIINNYLKSLNN